MCATATNCEISHVIQDGDLVAWLVQTTGTHTGDGLCFPATGKRFETVSANFGRFEGGVAVEHWSEQGMLPMLLQSACSLRPSLPERSYDRVGARRDREGRGGNRHDPR